MSGEQIEAIARFLEFGAVGLAGIMLLLTVITLVTAQITPARERLLRQYMYVGAACFVVAIVGEIYLKSITPPDSQPHSLTLEVAPHDFQQGVDFPAPVVRMSGQELDREEPIEISESATLIVDLTAGIDLFRETEVELASAVDEANTARDTILRQTAAIESAQEEIQTVSREISVLKSALDRMPARTPQLDRRILDIERSIGESLNALNP